MVRFITLCLGFLVVLPAGDAAARTWRVAADGNGEFTAIQAALDQAAAGDTISVAAGAYTDATEVDVDGTPTVVYALVDTDDLVLMGAGASQTIIGPAVSAPQRTSAVLGIAGRAITSLTVQTLGVHDIAGSGLDVRGGAVNVAACAFVDCGVGIRGDLTGASDIAATVLARCGVGVQVDAAAGGLALRSCLPQDCDTGIAVIGPAATDVVIDDPLVARGGVGLAVTQGGSASVARGVFSEQSVAGIHVTDTSGVVVIDCHLDEPAAAGIALTGHDARLSATGTVVESGVSAIDLDDCAQVSFTAGHVLRDGPGAWYVRAGPGAPPASAHVDLTGNWWGTTDPQVIASGILDASDSDQIRLIVDVDPIAGAQISTQVQTWGAIKSTFR